MFDKILKTRRDNFTLLEWADNEGWLSDISELIHLEIALLAFPYLRLDKKTEYVRYQETFNKFLSLCDAITEATESGELKSRTINLYDYKPEFRFIYYISPDLDLHGQATDYHGYERYVPGFRWIVVNQAFRHQKPIPSVVCDFEREPIHVQLIAKLDFKEWLITKRMWPLQDECLLNKWLLVADDANPQEPQKDGRKHGKVKLKADSFSRICKKHGIPINSNGLYIIHSKKWIKEIAKKEDPKLFLAGFDDFWKSKERREIAIYQHAARHRPKPQTDS